MWGHLGGKVIPYEVWERYLKNFPLIRIASGGLSIFHMRNGKVLLLGIVIFFAIKNCGRKKNGPPTFTRENREIELYRV